MKLKKIIIFLFSTLFLFSCSGAKDALQGKKRSNKVMNFSRKKEPLTVPPDIDELPVPLDQEIKVKWTIRRNRYKKFKN